VSAEQPVVYIVDDDARVREALSSLMGSLGIRSSAYGSAAEFLDADKPDAPACLILDLRLPDLDGLELQGRLDRATAPPIVFISGHGDVRSSVRAMKAGAVEFLSKPFGEEELLRAIEAGIARDRCSRAQRSEIGELRRRYDQLTPREREVLTFVVGGFSNKQTAQELGMSEVTAGVHRHQIMRKMAAHSVPELLRMADKLEVAARPGPAQRPAVERAAEGEGDVLSFGPFSWRARERRLERDGEAVKLGSRALELLMLLTERAGDVVTKEELTARVWPDTVVEENGLRVQIAGLRKALHDGIDGARYVVNVPGRGYCFVGALSRGRPESIRTAWLGRSAFPGCGLPPRLERIVGRGSDIAGIGEALLANRVVSVVGPGGMGKTTVAVAVAHALSAQFGGDVCFVDLSVLTDPGQVGAAIASSLGLATPAGATAETFAAFLSGRRALLLLDSCEHVLPSVAPLVESLVGDVDRLCVLATSRVPLRVQREQVHRLEPLQSPPDKEGVTAHEALSFPAAQLFVERASEGGAAIRLTDEDAAVVASICRRLDGVALAIELAAARVDAFGLRGVASLLDNRARLLWRGRRTAHPRQQTLSADLDWSYDLLGDAEKKALRRLSCLVGPFSLQAAAAIANDDAVDPDHVIHALGSLVEKSLVSMQLVQGQPRYRLLDTTRAYALEELAADDERPRVAARHARYFCALLETDRGAEHLGNVRAALEWSFSAGGDTRVGIALAAAAAPLFMALSLLKECLRWTDVALAALPGPDRGTHRELKLRAAAGVAAMFTQGHGNEVHDALRGGLALAEKVDDPHEQLRLLGALNIFLARAGEFRAGAEVAAQSEAVAQRLQDPAARMLADWLIGACRHLLGQQDEAEQRFRSALGPAADSPLCAMLQFGFDHRIRALALLAQTLWLLGRPEDAATAAAIAVRDATEVGQPTSVAMALLGRLGVRVWCGDATPEMADEVISYSARHSLGPYYWIGTAYKARVTIARNDVSGLEPLTRAAEALRAGHHLMIDTTFSIAMAQGLALAGRVGEALKTVEDALAVTAARNGTCFNLPELLRVKADLLATLAGPGALEAERCFLQSLECAGQQKALAWELRTSASFARFLAARGRPAEARERLAATYGQVRQGLQTSDAVTARALLSGL
jgi:predicted ATPase/FixJ family two-component response regulator/DNA-binding winged helix-turn-helix (wHTH) protein